jgi:drug/metabolite transporter (DMT)-like permease
VTGLALGLGLALLASLALNGSYLLQHVGAQDAPEVTVRHPLRTVRGLLRSRLWLAGLVAGLSGWALHVGALANAPLSLVQAFAAGGLALVVPAGTRLLHERLSRTELLAVALMVAALALLALGAHGAHRALGAHGTLGHHGHAGPALPVLALTAALTLAALLAAGLALRRRAGAATLGAAAGILYGAGDAATKAVTVTAHHHGLAAALASPWTGAVALLSAGAFFCFQRGLQSGAAVPVIALMTAGTNAAAILCGLLVLGDPLGHGVAGAAGHLLAFAAIGAAAWLLAPSQARLTAPPPSPPAAAPPATGGPLAA